MPKEVIYGNGLPYGTPEKPGPARSIIEVSWSPRSHVQIATRCVYAADASTPYNPQPGEPGFASLNEPSPGFAAMTSGIFTDLDRGGINRLIRNLRRARDQAFGRDE